MAQFQVPQFIEVEPKIIGPLTLKQFGWMAAAGAMIFILFFLISVRWVWILISLFLASAAVGLAFVKINGRPLISFIFDFFSFVFGSRLFLWRKEKTPEHSALAPGIITPSSQITARTSSVSTTKKNKGLKGLSLQLLSGEKSDDQG